MSQTIFFEGFTQRFGAAQETGNSLLERLSNSGKFRVEKFEDGTNDCKLFLKQGNANVFQKNLAAAGIDFPLFNEQEKCFVIKLNESLVGTDVEEMARLFLESR